MPQSVHDQLFEQVRERAQALAPPNQRTVKRVAVAVIGLAVVLAIWFTRSPGGVVAPPDLPSGPAVTTTTTAATEPGNQPVPTAGEVVVHVSGSVRRPGLVRLSPGARVLDAISAAGGLVRASDAESLNLARPVVDGEQIVAGAAAVDGVSAATPGASAASGGGEASGGGAVINLNTADADLLQELPGVGPVLAGRIVDWRTRNGPFRSVEDLGEVSGIGESRLADLRDLVRVG